MRAVMFQGPRRLEVVDLPPASCGADEVRLRVERSGICGSDLASWRGDWQMGTVPQVKGHEVCATVAEVGQDVTRVKPGDLVAVRPIRGCGQCRYCERGEYSRCKQFIMYGQQYRGGWAEEMVVRQDHARPLPTGVTADQGVFAEPIAVDAHAFNLYGPLDGKSVAILGAGTLGLLAIQIARIRGADRVYATGRQDRKLELALQFGAVVGDSRHEDVVERGLAEGGPYDVVLDCVGSSETLDQAIALSASGGMIVLVAGPHHARLDFDYVAFREREVAMIASRIYGEDFDDALDLLATGNLDLAPLLTHRFALADAPEALVFANEHRSDVIKAVLEP
ncbi:MAG: alcohol dehydrogenase catalytic domain-containing protein [Chloroflexi bacterium]|nr:alcohol dehydrogenase catalytic domain-containing protein [Chloroflexota bacterium]